MKRTLLERGIERSKISVVPDAPTQRFRIQPKQDEVFRIIAVGRLEFRKGIQYSLEAVQQLRLPNSELLLVGGPQVEFAPILKKYVGHYRLAGPVRHEELGMFYSQSSVLVLPSVEDGWSHVTLEAMACGLPAIAIRFTCNSKKSTMTNIIRVTKVILKQTPMFALYQVYKQEKLYREWIQAGKPATPPELAKQRVIKEYAHRFKVPVFIETGTYEGNMVNAVKDVFDEIYSIELGLELYQRAKRRFAGSKHVDILQGDSCEVLKDVLAQVERPCLFWLDGHYSGNGTARSDLETPILKELAHIFKHSMAHQHVILIDDARLFTGEGDYPGIPALKDLVMRAGFDNFEVEDDIIRIFKQV
jgi:hypothetical protein